MLKFKIVIVIVFVFVALGASEFALRISGVTNSWSENNGMGYESPYQTICGYYYLRDQGTSSYNTLEYKYPISVNSIGLREVEHSVSKPANEYRIIGLGDSFTEGAGAPFDSTWLNLMCDMLNDKCDSLNVVGINGGISGGDLFYSYYLFKNKLIQYHPDLVIFMLNYTDFNDFVVRGGLERFNGDTCVGKEPPKKEMLFKYSHLYRLILLKLFNYDWLLHSPSEQKAYWNEYMAQYESVVQDFQKFAKDNDFKFVIVMQPLINECLSHDYVLNIEKLKRIANSNGASEIDLLPLCDNIAANNESDLYWPIDKHYNSSGYYQVANLLDDKLQSLVLDRCN